MGSIYSKIKAIEADKEGIEHNEDMIGFYFASSKVEMTLDDTANLKQCMIDHKVIGEDDNIFLIKEDERTADIKWVCNDFRISDDLTEEFVKVINEADAYYKITADGSYERSGYLWSTCRLICKDDEYVLLDFYICD